MSNIMEADPALLGDPNQGDTDDFIQNSSTCPLEINKLLDGKENYHQTLSSYMSALDVISSRLPRSCFANEEVINTSKEILSIDPSERTLRQSIELGRFFKEGEIFKKLTVDEYIYDLASAARLLTIGNKGKLLLNQNEKGDTFYQVLDGSIDCFKVTNMIQIKTDERSGRHKKDEKPKIEYEEEFAFKLIRGECYGENSLIDPFYINGYTLRASPKCILVAIKRDEFKGMLAVQKKEIAQEIGSIYRFCKLFNGISDDKVYRMAEKSFLTKYPRHSVILRQDEMPINMYMVKTGGLKIITKIPKERIKMRDHLNFLDEKLYESLNAEVIMEIGNAKHGDYVCDHELIWQTPMKHSIITSLPTELIYLNLYEIIEILSTDDLKTIQTNIIKLPNEEEVIEKYIESVRWLKFKDVMLENIKFSSKTGDRIYPEMLMRSDIEAPKDIKNCIDNYLESSMVDPSQSQTNGKESGMVRSRSEKRIFQSQERLRKFKVDNEKHMNKTNFSMSQNDVHLPTFKNIKTQYINDSKNLQIKDFGKTSYFNDKHLNLDNDVFENVKSQSYYKSYGGSNGFMNIKSPYLQHKERKNHIRMVNLSSKYGIKLDCKRIKNVALNEKPKFSQTNHGFELTALMDDAVKINMDNTKNNTFPLKNKFRNEKIKRMRPEEKKVDESFEELYNIADEEYIRQFMFSEANYNNYLVQNKFKNGVDEGSEEEDKNLFQKELGDMKEEQAFDEDEYKTYPAVYFKKVQVEKNKESNLHQNIDTKLIHSNRLRQFNTNRLKKQIHKSLKAFLVNKNTVIDKSGKTNGKNDEKVAFSWDQFNTNLKDTKAKEKPDSFKDSIIETEVSTPIIKKTGFFSKEALNSSLMRDRSDSGNINDSKSAEFFQSGRISNAKVSFAHLDGEKRFGDKKIESRCSMENSKVSHDTKKSILVKKLKNTINTKEQYDFYSSPTDKKGHNFMVTPKKNLKQSNLSSFYDNLYGSQKITSHIKPTSNDKNRTSIANTTSNVSSEKLDQMSEIKAEKSMILAKKKEEADFMKKFNSQIVTRKFMKSKDKSILNRTDYAKALAFINTKQSSPNMDGMTLPTNQFLTKNSNKSSGNLLTKRQQEFLSNTIKLPAMHKSGTTNQILIKNDYNPDACDITSDANRRRELKEKFDKHNRSRYYFNTKFGVGKSLKSQQIGNLKDKMDSLGD